LDRVAHWRRVYETKADTEVSWFQARPSSLTLIAETGLGPDAAVVDVGAGSSRLVDHLLDAGYRDVTVLDIAPEALERAKARLGERAARVAWIAADVTRWRPERRFDLWHDRAAFHFLQEQEDRAAYAATMAAAVRSGGWAIVGAFALDGPEKCSGLPVRRYDSRGLAAEFADAFQLVAASREDHTTPAGKVQHFQFCRLRRR